MKPLVCRRLGKIPAFNRCAIESEYTHGPLSDEASGRRFSPCDSDVVILDLDVVTALGIVVAGLVTNSYDHAFPDGIGAIDVAVRRDPDNAAMASLISKDNRQGFEVKSGSKRHGLGLVRRLAEQVRGTANVASSGGATWTIDFPWPRRRTETKGTIAGRMARPRALHWPAPTRIRASATSSSDAANEPKHEKHHQNQAENTPSPAPP
jgi:hypothetical protein